MKIFISLKTPRSSADLRTASLALTEAICTTGHEPFLAWQEIEAKGLSPRQFMPFVRDEMRTCGLLLVLYHPALRGGLIEMGIAYASGIPIWLIYPKEVKVSSSALGCAERVLQYARLQDLSDIVREQIYSLSAL